LGPELVIRYNLNRGELIDCLILYSDGGVEKHLDS
jgi:hypothetical protein